MYVPQALSTFPSISSEDMATMQRAMKRLEDCGTIGNGNIPQLFVS